MGYETFSLDIKTIKNQLLSDLLSFGSPYKPKSIAIAIFLLAKYLALGKA